MTTTHASAIHTSSAAPSTAGLPAVAGLAAIAGLRSVMPLALLSARLTRATAPPPGPLALLARPRVFQALVLAAAGEVVADKLPFLPARTEPLPLAGRLAAGALVAVAATAAADGRHRANGAWRPKSALAWLLPAVAGAAAALAGSFLGYNYRRAGARARLPDLPLALAEDAIGLLAGRALLARLPGG